MPVPVPATANIAAAQGLELTLRDVEGEMVTPTGAAIAAAFRTEAALPKKYQIEKIGIGAGQGTYCHDRRWRNHCLLSGKAASGYEDPGTDHRT